MQNRLQCLFIGYNEMDFSRYEKQIRDFGVGSESYRDLRLNMIKQKDKAYTIPQYINEFYRGGRQACDVTDTFSATISYLGTFLHRHGITFDFIESFQREKHRIEQLKTQKQIDCIAISTTLYTSVFPIMEIMEFVRTVLPDVPVIVGGPFIANSTHEMNEEQLENLFRIIGAEYYINNVQGEQALVNLVRYIGDPETYPFESVENVYYKIANGTYKKKICLQRETHWKATWYSGSFLLSESKSRYLCARLFPVLSPVRSVLFRSMQENIRQSMWMC